MMEMIAADPMIDSGPEIIGRMAKALSWEVVGSIGDGVIKIDG